MTQQVAPECVNGVKNMFLQHNLKDQAGCEILEYDDERKSAF